MYGPAVKVPSGFMRRVFFVAVRPSARRLANKNRECGRRFRPPAWVRLRCRAALVPVPTIPAAGDARGMGQNRERGRPQVGPTGFAPARRCGNGECAPLACPIRRPARRPRATHGFVRGEKLELRHEGLGGLPKPARGLRAFPISVSEFGIIASNPRFDLQSCAA